MAHLFGRIEPGSLRDELTPIILLTGIAASAVTIMFWSGGNTTGDLSTAGIIGAVLTSILLIAYGTAHRRSLQRFIQPAIYRQTVELDTRVKQQFKNLSDTYFVFNHFIFELCRVEHLVISKNGIFVITKVTSEGKIRIERETLFLGNKSLESMTGKSWRVCHLANIILKKWFEIDYMPQPVLAVDNMVDQSISNYDGILIVPLEDLAETIKNSGQKLEQDTAHSFAGFVAERYVKKNL